MTTDTKTAHTPGPWALCAHLRDHDRCPCGYRGGIWGDNGSVIVCEMGGPIGNEGDNMIPRATREVQFADARLIAAAPELLAAVKELKAWIEEECGAELPSNSADLAIARAEGRQP